MIDKKFGAIVLAMVLPALIVCAMSQEKYTIDFGAKEITSSLGNFYVIKKFDQYYASYSTSPQSVAADIQCYDGPTLVGYLSFFKDDLRPAPQSGIRTTPTSEQVIQLYYPLNQFNDVINILRYNCQLGLRYNISGGYGDIYTREPQLAGIVPCVSSEKGGETVMTIDLEPEVLKQYSQPVAAAHVKVSKMLEKTDLPGSDLRSEDLTDQDPNLCAQICIDDPLCKAFVYGRPGTQSFSNPHCWLKDNVPSPVNADCCISGVIEGR
jgi:PAN domain